MVVIPSGDPPDTAAGIVEMWLEEALALLALHRRRPESLHTGPLIPLAREDVERALDGLRLMELEYADAGRE